MSEIDADNASVLPSTEQEAPIDTQQSSLQNAKTTVLNSEVCCQQSLLIMRIPAN